jgi:hypothetical protein
MLTHMLIIQVNLAAVSCTPKSGFGGEFVYVRGYGLLLPDKVFMLFTKTGQLLTVADTEGIGHNGPPTKNIINIQAYQLKHSCHQYQSSLLNMMSNQFHSSSVLKMYFPAISLDVILPTPSQSSMLPLSKESPDQNSAGYVFFIFSTLHFKDHPKY